MASEAIADTRCDEAGSNDGCELNKSVSNDAYKECRVRRTIANTMTQSSIPRLRVRRDRIHIRRIVVIKAQMTKAQQTARRVQPLF